MLNLQNLEVENVKETDTQYDIDVRCMLWAPPCCLSGVVLNGTKRAMFRDLPIHGKHVGIWVNRQRYKCRDCGKTLYQSLPHMHRSHEMTQRLVTYIERNSLERTFTALAAELGLSEFAVRNIFRIYAKRELSKLEPVTPEWMGLDELYILSKFRGIVTNVKDRTMVDMLPNRSKVSVIKYLAGIDDREKIKLVTIDMWNPYREAVHEVLPHARIVVDKFHVVRMANEALERIRKEHRVTLPVKGRLQLKDDRWMMLTNPEKLDAGRTILLESILNQFPLLKAGYEAKERFRAVWKAETPTEAQSLYDEWERTLPTDVAPAFNDLTTAMRNWRTEIFAYFDTRATNAYTESLNAIAKMTNRLGRGYSFEVLRAKLLLTRSCHKYEQTPYYRRGPIVAMGSGPTMSRVFSVNEEPLSLPPPKWLGIDLSTLATELRRRPGNG